MTEIKPEGNHPAPPQYSEIAPNPYAPPAGPGYGGPAPPASSAPPPALGMRQTTYTAAPPQQFPPAQRANLGTYQPLAPAPQVQQQSNTNVTVVTTQPTVSLYSMGVKPESYLGLSIFTCLCCCWLFGLIAIMYSSQVDSAWASGDYEGARSSARTALHWNIASIVVGIVLGVVGGVVGGVVSATSRSVYYYD